MEVKERALSKGGVSRCCTLITVKLYNLFVISLSLSLSHSLVWIWRVVAGEGKDYFFGRFKHKNILISKEFRKWNHSK